MSRKIAKSLVLLAVILSLLSATAVFSANNYYFDLIANFRIQYIVLIIPAILIALGYRAFFSALIMAACLSVHAVTVAESIKATRAYSITGGESLRIMTSNLLVSNQHHQEYIDHILSVNPDVVVFQEYSDQWHAAFQASLTAYPYKVTLPKPHPFGMALYSKFEIIESEVLQLFNPELPAIKARLVVGDTTLQIIGAHPTAPVSHNRYEMRSRQLNALATEAADTSDPLVLMGDLNITPWSAHFASFVQLSDLYDGRRGFGVLPTWPSQFFFLQIPIDHIMINSAVEITELKTGSNVKGSDHKSLWADIRIR